MTDIKIPNLAESISEVTLSKWLVKDGDYVLLDQALCELETDKASQEIYAEKAGKIQILVAEGSDIAVGSVIAKIDESVDAPMVEVVSAPQNVLTAVKPAEKANIAKAAVQTSVPTTDLTYASPAAAKLIQENGLDKKTIPATGKGGRITKEDVLNALKSGSAHAKASFEILQTQSPVNNRGERREAVSRLRKTIADRLVMAKNTTAMLTTFNEVDCSAMMKLRTEHADAFKEKFGIGLGYMSFFTKACALSLMKFPAVNAYLDLDKKEVIYHDFVDMSIAVSTPKGLVVPVIRNVEEMSLAAIEKAVKTLAVKGRDGQLSMEDMSGGTFTITNGGVFGSLNSTPIINPPQSAILGMHKIQERVMVIDGKMEIRPMMYVALSYDHRIIDGKESVSFLVSVKDYLEHPEKMLLGEDPSRLLLGL